QIADKDLLNVSCYPNPAAHDINLTIIPKKPGETSYTIRVTNSVGMTVRYAVIKNTQWQDNISNLLNGTYLIQVVENKNNSIVGQTKFVKL
ncbi:MAG: T9SS type A sorting domain-containing protein, partial [Mucilaginibacter sp.]